MSRTNPTYDFNNVDTGQAWDTAFNLRGPNKPDQIVPGLYISNIKTAGAYMLGKVPADFPRITHIVSILSDPTKKQDKPLHRLPALSIDCDPIDHLLLHESDIPTTNLVKHFDTTNPYIHTALFMIEKRGNSGGVLVHCFAGISRSATVVCAYLIKHRSDLFLPVPTVKPMNNLTNRISLTTPSCDSSEKETREDTMTMLAIHYLQMKRVVVKPNDGFVRQLKFYCFMLKRRSIQPKLNPDSELWAAWKELQNEKSDDGCFNIKKEEDNHAKL